MRDFAFDTALEAGLPQDIRDNPPGTIGVAVSGGGDSLALLLMLSDWARARDVAVKAVTVDHGLRKEAADEAKLVADICRRHDIPHSVLEWSGWDGKGNLQDAARNARLDLIAGWARENGIAVVALGHTLDDQAETVLMRLARGSGVDGLAGMAPRRTHDGITLIRPLLGMRRAGLRDYLLEKGVTWVEDPSNDDTGFDRVKARRLLEQAAELGIDAEGLAATATRMQAAREALAVETRRMAGNIARISNSGEVEIEARGLFALPLEIRRRLMAHALCWVAGAQYRPRLQALDRLLDDLSEPGGTATLSGCVVSHDRHGILRVNREPKAVEGLTGRPGEIWDGRWIVTPPAALADAAGFEVRALGEEGLSQCRDWKQTHLTRASLIAAPAVWKGETLVAAPLAGKALGWSAELAKGRHHFFDSIIPD